MNRRCPVCFHNVRADGTDSRVIGVAGRKLFRVHRQSCSDVVSFGTDQAAKRALSGLRGFLAREAPTVGVLLDNYAAKQRGDYHGQG